MDAIEHIKSTFKEHRLFVEEVYQIDDKEILVCISWGDWKHEHLCCDKLMESMGYTKIQEIITEDNGTDCYSSEHTFIKM